MHRYTVIIALLSLLVLAGFAQAGNIGNGNLKVVPQASAIDEETIHVIKWAVVSQIDLNAKFVLYYHPDFELNENLTIIADTYDPNTLDGRLNIDSIDTTDPNWKKVLLSRQDKTTTPDFGDTVGIKLGLVGNPQNAGEYLFRLEVLTFDSVIEDSGSALIKINEPISDFTLQLSNNYPRAGQPFELRVINAVDAEGNPADGIIEVSFENKTLEEFAAADGTLPDLVSIAVKDGTGKANQIIYKPEITQFRLQGTVSGGSTVRYSPNLRVNYGDLAAFEMTGYPLSTKAGFGFDNPINHTVTVKAFDSWQNLKRDYRGQIYFKSDTDAKAYFYYKGSGTPSYYQFTDIDDGQHTFPGDNFSLRTSGYHTFSVWNEPQTVSETSDLIEVVPGTISSFTIETPPTQTAGQSFNVRVSNAVDDQGNPSSGTIRLSQVGGGQAPNGQQPVFNDISIVNGEGSSFQSLVKAGSVQLSGTLLNATVSATSGSFTLLPGILSSFTMANVPVKAQINVPFSQNIIVTAYDGYGNIKTNFLGQVGFASTDPNASLPASQNFQSGDQGVRSFPGSDFILRTIGDRTIRVISGTVSKTSNIIEVTGPNSIVLDQIVATNTTVSQGQTNITVTMIARNNGTDPFENVSANLTFADALQNSVTTDYVTQITGGQGTIPAQTSEWPITFSVNVKSDATLGDITIDGSISGYYNGVQDSETSANLPDVWQVQFPAALQILSTTLDDSISKGSSPNVIRVRVANNSGQSLSAAAVVNNIGFTFTNSSQANVDAEFPVTPVSIFPATIAGNDTSEFTFNMESKATAPTGTITVATTVNYQDANIGSGQPKTATSNPATTFESIAQGAIDIVSITPSDSTVTQGQTNDFYVDVQVRNLGGSATSISTDPALTYIKFKLGNQEYISNQGDVTWPPAQVNIPAGGTGDVRFTVTRVQNSVPAADLSIISKMTTTNGISSTSEQSDVYGTLTVQKPENIVIQSVTPSRQTVTVDDTTPWEVQVVVQNTGGSDVFLDLANSDLNFNPVSGFLFETPSVSGDNILEANETETLTFRVTRNGSTAGTATISATLDYEVINTNESKTASGGNGSVDVQEEANVVILSTTSTPSTVSQNYASAWTVAVVVQNVGQAEAEIDVNSDSTWLQFYKDGFEIFNRFNVTPPTELDGKGTTRLAEGETGTLLFNVSPNNPDAGDYIIEATVKSIELNRTAILYSQTTAQTSGSVTVTTPANVSYVANTLNPTFVVPGTGRSEKFTINVLNQGSAPVELNPSTSTFSLGSGAQKFTAPLSPSSTTTIVGNDSTALVFENFIPVDFPKASYVPQVVLNGIEHGEPITAINLDMYGEQVVVGEGGAFSVTYLKTSVNTVTQGQTKDWTIRVGLNNNSSVQTLKFKNVKLQFQSGATSVTDKFNLLPVGTTLTNGSEYLSAGDSAAVLITVDQVQSTTPDGDVLISAEVTMTDDQGAGDTKASINYQGPVTVQTPANLSLESSRPSQKSITRGQTESWSIGARVKNNGESAVKLDSVDMKLDIFDYSENFLYSVPTEFLNSGIDTLYGGQEDSLNFIITQVPATLAATLTGESIRVAVYIGTNELNTGLPKDLNTESNPIHLTVNDSARVRIEKFEPMIESSAYVNAGGEFYLRALVKNSGGTLADSVSEAVIRLSTVSPGYTFESGLQTETASVFNLAPGDTAWTDSIKVLAPPELGRSGQFTISFDNTVARNTTNSAIEEPVTVPPVVVSTQQPANLNLTVTSSDDVLDSGMERPWTISAVVKNNGQGVVRLYEPTESDVVITNAEGVQVNESEYGLSLEPLTTRELAANDTALIAFEVAPTWRGKGIYQIRVNARAQELNNIVQDIELSGQTTVQMSNEAKLFINATQVDTATANVENGIAHVNKGQTFNVNVQVRNNSNRYLDSVYVSLNPSGKTIAPPPEVFPLVGFGNKMVTFTVTAASDTNLAGEELVAKIDYAKLNGGGFAEIEQPVDSSAIIKIHEPTRLQILSVENIAPNAPHVSVGHNFNVRVKIQNNGSEDARNVGVLMSASPADGRATVNVPNPHYISGLLAGGAIDSLDFAISANDTGAIDITSQLVNGFGVNQPDNAAFIDDALDDSARAFLKPGANLVIDQVVPTDSSVIAGDRNNPWYIKAVISNTGKADLQFIAPRASDVLFSRDGTVDPDYRVTPPSFLDNSGNLILRAGETDTLRYTIGPNGYLPGMIDVTVTLNAVDLNVIDLVKNPNPDPEKFLTASGSTTIQAEADVQVWIARTQAETNIRNDGNGFALVNVGQDFTIAASIQTGQLGGVESVIVELTSDYLAETLVDTISTIDRDATVNAVFPIPAASGVNPATREDKVQFSARIIKALVKGDTEDAIVRAPVVGANIAKVRIQEPAVLIYTLQVGDKDSAYVKTGEPFEVVAKMQNLGRAPIGQGVLRVYPPVNYRVIVGQDTTDQFVDLPNFVWELDEQTKNVSFTMLAPDEPSAELQDVRTSLVTRPVDLNDSTFVELDYEKIDSTVAVIAVDNILSINNFVILAAGGEQDSITLSTEQQFTLRAVVQSAKNFQKIEAVLDVNEELGYSIQPGSEKIVPITSQYQVVEWIIEAPTTRINFPHELELTVSGEEENGSPISVPRSVQINAVETKASLTLQNIVFDPPSALINGDAYFSTGQTGILIKTKVENMGEAQYKNDGGSGTVTLDLGVSGLYFADGYDAEETFFDNAWLQWEVYAQPDVVVNPDSITITVSSGTLLDENTNEPVPVNLPASKSVMVNIQERGTIDITDLDVYDIKGQKITSVSSGQNFIVKAIVRTERVQEDRITATLNSLDEPALFEPIPRLIEAYYGEAEWTIQAPEFSTLGDNTIHLYVSVEANDRQSGEPLNPPESRSKEIAVVQRTQFKFTPFIAQPEILKDINKVSTDQEFEITTDIEHFGSAFLKESTDQFVVRLSHPNEFQLIESREVVSVDQYLAGQRPTWKLRAPSQELANVSNFDFTVTELPRDSLSKSMAIPEKRDITLPIRSVEKARVSFFAYLQQDELLDSTGVRRGNNFTVTGWLDNRGSAKMAGRYALQLVLPVGRGYTFVNSDSLVSVKSMHADSTDSDVETISWSITAPRYGVTTVPDSFRLKIVELPVDEFSRKPVDLLSADSAVVLVSLETGSLIVENYDVQGATNAVVRGDSSVAVFGMALRNKGGADDVISKIDSVTLSVLDKRDQFINPQPLFTRIAAVDGDNVNHIYAETHAIGDSGKIVMHFPKDSLLVLGQEIKKLTFIVDIPSNAAMQDFRLAILDTSDISAQDEFFIPLMIIAAADTLPRSQMAVMIDADIDKSFFNYPNPFGRSEDPVTKFTYYLKEPSDVKIHIYTLTGDLVKTWDITQAENEEWTRAGLHQGELIWDGKNGIGQPVLNGVYLAYILTGYGDQSMTKIAVVK